jgi:polyhydroxyalkanoate synthesis regulator phasin
MKKTTNEKKEAMAEVFKYIAAIKAKYGYKSNKEISIAMDKNEVYLSSIRTRGLPKNFMGELQARFPDAIPVDVKDRYAFERYWLQILTERVASILVELSGGTKIFRVEVDKIADEAIRLGEYDAKRASK